jgi:hypothetical protein
MPLFTFIGGPECGDIASINMYGVVFPLGVPTPVNDLFIERKLRGNRFFTETPDDDGDSSAVGGPGAPEDGPVSGGSGEPAVVGIDGDAGGDRGEHAEAAGDQPGGRGKRDRK